MSTRRVDVEDSLQSDNENWNQMVKGSWGRQRHPWSLAKRLLSLAGEEDNVKSKLKISGSVHLQNVSVLSQGIPLHRSQRPDWDNLTL